MTFKKPLQANKRLAQHFLHDKLIAQKIVHTLRPHATCQAVVEIGPGRGALTKWLMSHVQKPLYLVEVDSALASFLKQTYVNENVQIITANFLKWPLQKVLQGRVAVIGNLPYNISSPILFKLLSHRDQVQEIVCMLQQEVAQRITASAGSKTYGILSVRLQAFYDVSYCFTVPPTAFVPPPKVTSAVVRMVRNDLPHLACDETLFCQIVKVGFQQRRKMLRNALKPLGKNLNHLPHDLLQKRAEALTVADFIQLTNQITHETH